MLTLALLAACAGPPTEAPVPRLELGAFREVALVTLTRGSWGREFHRDPDSAVVPMAVIADGDGLAVLDQEALRIRRFDATGRALGDLPIPDRATLDAVRRPDREGYGLLAYHRTPTPTWVAQDLWLDGTLAAETPLSVGDTPPSGIFADGERLLVELAHGDLVDPATGERFPGRPAGDGWYARAEKLDDFTVGLTWQDREGIDVRRVRLALDRTVSNVVSLDPFTAPDGLPAAQVGLLLYDEGPAPDYAMLDAEIRVVVLDALGHLLDEVRLPVLDSSSSARPFARTADGALLALRVRDDGLTLERTPLAAVRP
ncbi:MAG: hypothetical protein ABIO70_17330 [Pseudomonadota bacterium]